MRTIPVSMLLAACAIAMSVVLPACSKQGSEPTAETAAPATAGESSVPARYDAKAFFTTTSYALAPGFAWSSDDSELLIQSDQTGIFNAYTLAAAGANPQALTRSTADSTYVVSWFPDDGRVLYTADQGGNELNHLYVRELDGTARDLTPGGKVRAEFLDWAADRKSFYALTNERDAKTMDLYRYSAKDYARKLVFRNDGAWLVGALSPDERHLALVKRQSSSDADIYLLDLQSARATPQLITRHQGNVSHAAYDFTRDSKQLVYATDEFGEFTQAWTYALADGKRAPLIKADWDVSFVGYSWSGNYRVWGINQDARTVVHILDQRTGKQLALSDLPPGDISQVRFSRDERKLALGVSSDTSPTDVYTVDIESGASKRLTHALNPGIEESDLVATQVVRYQSFDGLVIPAILYKPKTASAGQRVPALVWVHGGPGGQSRTGYSAAIQHLVNHGYAVLAANNRGSSGYGKTFFHADDKRHGDVDLQDIVYGKTYLQSLDWVDPQRIGIIGGSYGGFMVGAALAFSPDTFAVGIDIFGVMNWLRTLTNIPPWWESEKKGLYDELGDPATDEARLRRISPLFHAKNIRVPFLVIQGANDPRVLKVESDEIVAAVKSNGVPVEYVVFPDEGHGFTKRNNRIAASEAYVKFLDTHLKHAGGKEPAH